MASRSEAGFLGGVEAAGIQPARRSVRTVIGFSPQIAGPNPAISASTTPDPVEVTR
jgi:hypothetical protein